MKRPEFIMLVGIPGSGKTTYAKKLKESYLHISSDSIRKELFGNEDIQTDSNQVFYIMRERSVAALIKGQSVVYDATNISRKFRAETLSYLPQYVVKKCVIVWADIASCINRNSQRERQVPETVIDRMLRSFQAPFYDEGFDSIEVDLPKYFDSNIYSSCCIDSMKISQDNSHHTLTLIEHCFETKRFLNKELSITDPELLCAAAFHDVGKPITKSFTNTKDETTDEAHYYGHQGAGAWISYGIACNTYVAWLISTHMEPFNNSKYYQKLPAFLKEPIDLIHKADLGAH